MNAARRWIAALLATWRGRLIAVFVVVQLVLPLHYYALRRDKHDERFAWRMFSPMRMVVCSDPDDLARPLGQRRPPRFTVGNEPPIVLGTQFHEAWVELTKRGRYAVLERIGETLCAVHRGQTVKLAMTCTYLDGTKEEIVADDLCAQPEL